MKPEPFQVRDVQVRETNDLKWLPRRIEAPFDLVGEEHEERHVRMQAGERLGQCPCE
jgi:hypothetical protein